MRARSIARKKKTNHIYRLRLYKTFVYECAKFEYHRETILLLHFFQVIRHGKLGVRLALDFIHGDTRRQLRQGKATRLSVYLEDALKYNNGQSRRTLLGPTNVVYSQDQ